MVFVYWYCRVLGFWKLNVFIRDVSKITVVLGFLGFTTSSQILSTLSYKLNYWIPRMNSGV